MDVPPITKAFDPAAVVPVMDPENILGELLLIVSEPVPNATVPDPVKPSMASILLLRSSVPVTL